MASATASTRSERWRGRWSLRRRILAVNLFALVVLAGGLLYLDSYRDRLIEQRREELQERADLAAAALGTMMAVDPDGLEPLARRIASQTGTRVVVLTGIRGSTSTKIDTLAWSGPGFELRSPASEPARRRIASALDRAIDALVGTPAVPPWPGRPEATVEKRGHGPGATGGLWRAPDGALVVTAASDLGVGVGDRVAPVGVVHLTAGARDITYAVRDERLNSFLVFLGALGLSLLLSTWLARTIVTPLRRLAVAARRVRLGRARDVTVPRLPERRDEIGQLARAVSDMTQALRQRIDATEAFAADVAHEIKNPLASLRSALETFTAVEDPALRAELIAVMTDDVARLDRLITDISDASRLDAEISRARFTRVDLGAMVGAIVRNTQERTGAAVGYEPPPEGVAVVLGNELRLGQVVRNLLENAISFSPPGARVDVRVERFSRARVYLVVEDRGPGVPPENREDIFKRFYSQRPEAEPFGKHSGLGLAIARAVVEAHDGTIAVEDRERGGARFTVALPAAP